MRLGRLALVVAAFAGAGIGVTYAVDAAFPDRHRLEPIHVDAVRPLVLIPPTGTVDYAEFGYPAYTAAGSPELRRARALSVPVAGDSVATAFLRVQPAKDESVAWIWLVVAGVLCALMVAVAVYLWRRRQRPNVA